jgi:uncharacterized protein YndB with AHSA1/START domain
LVSFGKLLLVVLAGPVAGLVLVALPYFLITGQGMPPARLHPVFSFSLLVLLPLVQGLVGGLAIESYIGKAAPGDKRLPLFGFAVVLMLGVDYGLAFYLLKEGAICLIMASPLFAGVGMLGLWVGYLLARFKRAPLQASLLPLVVVAVVYDTRLPPPVFANAISDAVTINASPEQVWRYIVAYPENNAPPDYWLWQIGLPVPVQSTAAAASVGARRECRFTDGIVFVEEITELTPNKVLTFKVTAQPDHPEIIGHFSLDKGQLYLEANADGTTTVIATSWYRIFVRPARYFDWWASDIVRNVHFRVLHHIRDLSEADRRKAGGSNP